MHNHAKYWLMGAAGLILVGCVLFVWAMAKLDWDFSRLSTAKFETVSYEIRQDFRNIQIKTDTADILLVPSQDGQSRVTCYEPQNAAHTVTVQDGTLVIEINDTRKWYEYVGIQFSTPRITVSIPQGEYGSLSMESDTGDAEIPDCFRFESVDMESDTGDLRVFASASSFLKLKTGTGDIHLEGVSAANIFLSVSTGKITLSHVDCPEDMEIRVSTGKAEARVVRCGSFLSQGSTGDLLLTDVIAREGISVTRTTGDVRLDQCDAAQLSIQTDTGDVSGSLLSEKVFIAHTDTGTVQLPQTTQGGLCEIRTDTGDIRITAN